MGRPARRRTALVLLLAAVGLVVPGAVATVPASAAQYALAVSTTSDRSAPQPLDGSTRSGTVYVFVPMVAGMTKVSFWLDDPNRLGAPRHVESWQPWDFVGGSDTVATGFDTRTISNGQHSITATVVDATTTTVLSAVFTVSNGSTGTGLQVSTSPTRSSPIPLAGATVSNDVYVFVPATTGITQVSFRVDDPARSGPAAHVEQSPPWDLAGGSDAAANPFSTWTLSAGSHIISADVVTSGVTTRLDATFSVSNPTWPTSYRFFSITSSPNATTEAQTVVVDDRMYLFGGFDETKGCCTPTDRAYVYDSRTNAWRALAAMPSRGVSHAGIDTDHVRYVYYAGGYAADAAGTGQVYATTAAWRYDIVANAYSALPSLPAARGGGGLAYLDNALYYFGGSNLARTADTPDVWRLDLAATGAGWQSVAPMPNPRNHLGWAVLGGRVYAVGGQHLTSSATPQNEIDAYDPATNTWTTLPPLPTARSHVMDSTFVLAGRLVVASGFTASDYSAKVEAYDPTARVWSTLTPLPVARSSAFAKPLTGQRYLYGGGGPATAWLASPSA